LLEANTLSSFFIYVVRREEKKFFDMDTRSLRYSMASWESATSTPLMVILFKTDISRSKFCQTFGKY